MEQNKKENYLLALHPSNKATQDCIGKIFIGPEKLASVILSIEEINMSNQKSPSAPFDILILDNREPQIGDKVYAFNHIWEFANKEDANPEKENVFYNKELCLKIIASSDKELTPENIVPVEFMTDYAAMLNNKNRIKFLELETDAEGKIVSYPKLIFTQKDVVPKDESDAQYYRGLYLQGMTTIAELQKQILKLEEKIDALTK